MFLDTTSENSVDWNEIAAILEDAYRTVAPNALVAPLANESASHRPRET